jgi:hypothetical protein
MHEATEILGVPEGKTVACRVIRSTSLGNGNYTTVGEVRHLNPAAALQALQEGDVRIERNRSGKIVTADDPTFLPPLPEGQVKVRLISVGGQRIRPYDETEPRHFERGAEIIVSERDAVQLCSGGNPSAERVEDKQVFTDADLD